MLYKDLGMISTVLDERRLPSLRGDAGDRPLPLLDDRLDDLGERPADVPPGAAPAIAIGHNGNLVNTRELLDQLRGGRRACRPPPTRSS